MERHNPPCNDPECMPCWWDALDREMYGFKEKNKPKASWWRRLLGRLQ